MEAVVSLFCIIAVRFGSSFSPTLLPAAKPQRHRQTSLAATAATNLQIRDWRSEEGNEIIALLRSAEDGSFNPEGSLDLDCTSESLLRESYDPVGGGCFMVAVDTSTAAIGGVAGLIVGTPVEYQQSGSSRSSAQTTAAIRRCCCRTSFGIETLNLLVTALERRALQADATQVIALAYPPAGMNTDKGSMQKPSPQLLESLGYQILPQQLPGVDVVQYGKDLPRRPAASKRRQLLD